MRNFEQYLRDNGYTNEGLLDALIGVRRLKTGYPVPQTWSDKMYNDYLKRCALLSKSGLNPAQAHDQAFRETEPARQSQPKPMSTPAYGDLRTGTLPAKDMTAGRA